MHFSRPCVMTMPWRKSSLKRGGSGVLPLSSILYSYVPRNMLFASGLCVGLVARPPNYSRDFLSVWQRSSCSSSRCRELWSLICVRTLAPICGGVSSSRLSGRRRLVIVLSFRNIFILHHPIESAGLRVLLYARMSSTHSRLLASSVRQ